MKIYRLQLRNHFKPSDISVIEVDSEQADSYLVKGKKVQKRDCWTVHFRSLAKLLQRLRKHKVDQVAKLQKEMTRLEREIAQIDRLVEKHVQD